MARPPAPTSPLRRRLLMGGTLGSALGLGGVLVARALPGSAPRPPAVPDEVCIVAPTLPYNPASGLAPLAARPVPPEARCPVCGMFAARHPRWAAQAIFDDGAVQFFDTPAHLFLYLQRPGHYQRGRSAEAVRAMYTADHRSGAWLPLDQAVFVHGSRALGPMRTEDLPAFTSTEAATTFIAEAGGQVARAADLRQALPEGLRALAPHRH